LNGRRVGALRRVAAFCAALTGLAGTVARAEPVADFYRGKVVRVVIGIEPGTAYDLYARLVARYIGKYLPGAPTVVAQNMAGAGSLNAYNYLYNVAPRDGLAFGTGHRFVPLMPLLGLPGAQFDARKFSYVGSANREVDICVARADSGVASIDDWRGRELLVGTTGAGAELTTFYGTVSAMLGVKNKVVLGYRSQNDLFLAVERGEIQGRCGGSYLNLMAEHAHLVKDGIVNIVLQIGQNKDRALPDTPLLSDLVTDPRDRAALDLMLSPNEMGRPFVAPPDTPAERLAALREAFDATTRDKEFLADAAAQSLDIDPVGGARMAELVAKAYAAPEDVVARARALVGGK
jgi:tripartite-type tricarboxylate transporter receptor subunit TctC